MNDVNNIKRRPILTIIAGVFTLLNLFVVIASLVLLSTGACSWIALIIAVIITITSFVLSIISFTKHQISLRIPILVFNIILLAVSSWIYIIEMLAISFNEARIARENDARERAIQYAQIEYVKESLPNDKHELINYKNKNTIYHCYDDGLIVNKFKAMEFTLLENFSNYDKACLPAFFNTPNVKASFFTDYSGLIIKSSIKSPGMFSYYHFERQNVYSVNPEEAQQLYEMIDQKIDEQMVEYKELEETIYNSITFSSIIDDLEKDTSSKLELSLSLELEKDRGYKWARVIDEKRELLNILKEVDESKITVSEKRFSSSSNYFEYKNLKQDDCRTIRYSNNERLMELSKQYLDIYNKWQTMRKVFIVDPEVGNYLMEQIEKIITDMGDNFNYVTTQNFIL